MPTIRPFQVFIVALFAFLAVLSIILISIYKPPIDEAKLAFGSKVVIWGTLPYSEVSGVLAAIAKENKAFDVVSYVDIDPANFHIEFVNAIAEGRSPDLVLMPHTEIVRQRSKLVPIPYTTVGFTQRDIRDRFIDGAEIFALSDGLYAIPFAVDPLIVYWNRDMFSSAGLASSPTSWEQLVGSVAPKLTQRDNNRTILKSAVAFGEYRNVKNAYGVLSLLMLQAGSPMVRESQGTYVVALDEAQAGARPPLEASLQFYADFANSASALYSWNRGLEEDQLGFLSGDLAMYFGYGSEAEFLQNRNPNLNFDIAMPPQGAAATIARTYGTYYGFAIPRASTNQSGAFNAAVLLSQSDNMQNLTRALRMAPVERGLVASGGEGSFEAVIYQAALISRGWLSPDPVATNNTFQTMVEDVVSNRLRVGNSVNDAIDRLILVY